MSRAVRLVCATALACASVPLLGAGPAYADAAVLVPTNSAYFYAAGIDKPDASPQAPPNVTASADGVSAGNLAVAAKGGSEDKVSFLYFDLFSLPDGVTVTKAVVSLPTVPNSPTDISYQNTAERVQACTAGPEGFSDDDGANIATSAPARLCKDFSVKGTTPDAGKTYAFDVTALANKWVEGFNDGVAFTRADEASSSNFQVVFGKASEASLALTYSLPAVTAPVSETPVTQVPNVTAAPPASGGGSGFTPTDGGFSSGTPAFVPPMEPTPTVGEAPAPAVEQAPAAVTKVAFAAPSMRPTVGFWLAGFALVAALALLSLIFGDTRVPAAQRSRSRLSTALSSRQGVSAAKASFRPISA